MSIKIMAAMWEHGPTDGNELLVMLALADIANDEGVCWPSMATIGQRARMSERNARRVIRKLEEDGWIATEPGRGRNVSNVYRIVKTGQSVRPDNLAARTNEAENRTNETLKPDTAMSGEPSRNHHRTIIKEEATSVASKKERGTRLPADWSLPADLRQWAADHGLSQAQIDLQADSFADYWHARPGSGGVKLDWAGTWRNWCRKALERAPPSQQRKPYDTAAAFARAFPEMNLDKPQ